MKYEYEETDLKKISKYDSQAINKITNILIDILRELKREVKKEENGRK